MSHRRRHHRSTVSKPTTTPTDLDREDCDPEVWEMFDTNFRQVQNVLDRNRHLIQQVNENHQSRIPDNMVKNVALIQELNHNITKVASLYSDLSNNFSNAVVHVRNNSHGTSSGNSNTSKDSRSSS